MERFRQRGIVLLATLFGVAALVGAASVDRDLEGIKQKIVKEKKGLSQLELKEGSVLESLGKIQGDLDKRTQELKIARAKLAEVVDDLTIKESEARRLNESVTARQEIFQKRAAALYRWQKSGRPLVVFNGDLSLGAFLQRRRYLQTAIAFDRDLLTQLQEESQHQEILRQELLQKKTELSEQRRALGVAQAAVRYEAEKKKVLLTSLRREKSTRLRVLKEMEAAAARLEKMLEEISRRAMIKPKESPPLTTPGTGIEAMRGLMEWPVKGTVSARFGKFKHPEFAAEIVRNGIDIDAAMGEEIRAVERGRVVYAERFSGYGKMVIIDHGERYFTIYGHLSEILKKNGDDIRRGEILGRVGESDSLVGAKLYFEMRKEGRSVDPLPWLKKQ